MYEGEPEENELIRWRREHPEEYEAFDDVTGGQLDASEVNATRMLETQFFRRMKVYSKMRRKDVPKSQRVIPVRWVDINKGDDSRRDYRSRLVAKQFRAGTAVEPEWFAGGPSAEGAQVGDEHSGDEENGYGTEVRAQEQQCAKSVLLRGSA